MDNLNLCVSVTDEFSKQFDNIDDVVKLLIACREISSFDDKVKVLQEEIKELSIQVDNSFEKVMVNKGIITNILRASGREVVYIADMGERSRHQHNNSKVFKITCKEGEKLAIEEKNVTAFVSAEDEALIKLLSEEVKDLKKRIADIDSQRNQKDA